MTSIELLLIVASVTLILVIAILVVQFRIIRGSKIIYRKITTINNIFNQSLGEMFSKIDSSMNSKLSKQGDLLNKIIKFETEIKKSKIETDEMVKSYTTNLDNLTKSLENKFGIIQRKIDEYNRNSRQSGYTA